jgi:hypothetical protein
MRRCLSIILSVAVAATCSAADAVKSGPQPKASLPGPFHFLNINGEHAGNLHCLVCEYGLRPTVAVFARDTAEGNKALASLLKKLDEAIGLHKNARLRGFAVILSEDFPKEEGAKDVVPRLEKLAADLELKNVIVTVNGPAGPENYKINKDAEVTVLVYQNQQVLANFAYAKEQFGEKDADAILAEVNKLVGAKKK